MKRVLWLVILAAALLASGLSVGRWQAEQANRTVEIVYDLPGLQALSETAGLPLEVLLQDLKQAGVGSVAVQPENLGEWFLQQKPLPAGILARLPQQAADLAHLMLAPVAFREEDLQLVQEAGLQAVPKLNTVPWDVEPVWLNARPDLLILSGAREFPAEHLYDSQARLALVEFHEPGTSELRELTDRMVRLHAVSAAEMEALPGERILNRYLRAVRERNSRVLYLRSFLEGEECWQRSLELLGDLQGRLVEAGFILGEAQGFVSWKPAAFWSLLVGAGIWAAAVLYGQSLFPRFSSLICAVGALGWLVSLAAGFTFPALIQQGQALLAAVVFPCLALQAIEKSSLKRSYWLAASVSLLGALLITGSLTGPLYLLKIEEFRGVKLMHILPLLVVLFNLLRPIKAWLNKNVPVKYLAAAGCAALLVLFYVLRTGNFGLPVPSWEIQLREGLEGLLRTRPRTKEFLVGHPALYWYLQSRHPHRSWWLPLAVVGQVSLLNTFTHIHSPLGISLMRTLYGLILGYLLGAVTAWCYGRGKRWLHSDRGIRLLRVRQSGR